MTNDDEIRAAFEKWAPKYDYPVSLQKDFPNVYQYSITNAAYEGFKAGYTAQKVATPEKYKDVKKTFYKAIRGKQTGTMSPAIRRDTEKGLKAALRALGYVVDDV